MRETCHQIRSFSVAVLRPPLQVLSKSLSHLHCYQWLPPLAIRRVFQGWTQENSYLNRRGSRTKRGVRADSPAWSEPPNRD